MIELRKDIISSRWVIINDTRDFQFDFSQTLLPRRSEAGFG